MPARSLRSKSGRKKGSASGSGGGRCVSLPVVGQDAGAGGGSGGSRAPRSRRGRWRAAVLIGVHVVFAVHIIQWLVTGMTVSPVEPSESMETLELGSINAGFIFFILAILSTLVFGRYFCGWGCHVVALQDLCSWLMRRAGMRPKPFRSRLLVLAPLIFGLYMFVWPSFKRMAIKPALAMASLEMPPWLRDVAPLKGFHAELIVADFWATFPPWYIAVPFLVVVGFASVYFLGSKGFCTYGCPYGGIFAVADQVSPGRIVVDENCDACGHCTAVCTSNVRVHEEVRDFGMVVDPGCMKCMDCVSACPNDALGLGFTTPAVLAKPVDEAARKRQEKIKANPKRFDLTWREELVLAVLFVVLFQSFRGMLNVVPMLMAAGLAGIGVFLAWKLWSLVRSHSVRLQRLQLKVKGRWRPAGVGFAAVAVLGLTSGAWSGLVGLDRWRAQLDYKQLDVPIEVALRPEYEPRPEVRRAAERGARLYTRSASWTEGGIGWALHAPDRRELAFLHLLAGDYEAAERQLHAIVRTGRPTAELIDQLARVMEARGATDDEVRAMRRRALEQHPGLDQLRTRVATDEAEAGAARDKAGAIWTERLTGLADPPIPTLLEASRWFLGAGDRDRARNLVDRAQQTGLDTPGDRLAAATILLSLGDAERARALVDPLMADGSWRELPSGRLRGLVLLFAQLENGAEARELLESARKARPGSASLHELAGRLALSRDATGAAIEAYRTAIQAEQAPWALASTGEATVKAALNPRRDRLLQLGLETFERALADAPDAPTLKHDYGQALLASGRFEAGLAQLREACELAPSNSALAAALAQAERRVESMRGRQGPPR